MAEVFQSGISFRSCDYKMNSRCLFPYYFEMYANLNIKVLIVYEIVRLSLREPKIIIALKGFSAKNKIREIEALIMQ